MNVAVGCCRRSAFGPSPKNPVAPSSSWSVFVNDVVRRLHAASLISRALISVSGIRRTLHHRNRQPRCANRRINQKGSGSGWMKVQRQVNIPTDNRCLLNNFGLFSIHTSVLASVSCYQACVKKIAGDVSPPTNTLFKIPHPRALIALSVNPGSTHIHAP